MKEMRLAIMFGFGMAALSRTIYGLTESIPLCNLSIIASGLLIAIFYRTRDQMRYFFISVVTALTSALIIFMIEIQFILHRISIIGHSLIP